MIKSDFIEQIRPSSWKNIPIPVVESIERLVAEFESLNSKLNRHFEGIKRTNKKFHFEITRNGEAM